MQGQRYQILDALRGFALIGVIIVNAGTINGPFWMDTFDFAFQTSALDSLVTRWSFIFFVEKFYPLFVFLFGLSASLMMTYRKSLSQTLSFFKRLLWLAVFGFLHIVLFFWGDVLLIYALLGVILLPVSKLGHRKIFMMALGLFFLTIIVNIVVPRTGLPEHGDLMVSLYGQGTFFEIMKQRLSDYYEWYYWGIFQGLIHTLDYGLYYGELLAFMMLGFAMGKYKDYFNNAHLYKHLFLKTILLSSLGICLLKYGEFLSFEWISVFSSIEKLLFTFLYLSGFCCLYLKMGTTLRKLCSSAGRMTLTWYLTFSALMSFVLHGYGLGLYGKVGPSVVVGWGLVYLAICFSVSPFWLRKFGQGPIEKVWRTLIGNPPK